MAFHQSDNLTEGGQDRRLFQLWFPFITLSATASQFINNNTM